MCRKMIYLMFSALLVGLVGNVSADHWWQDQDPNDHRWCNPGNWDQETVPTSSDKAGNNKDYEATGFYFVIDSNCSAAAGNSIWFMLGYTNSNARGYMTGGTFDVSGDFRIAASGGNGCLFEITNGTVTITGELKVNESAGTDNNANLHGGTINAATLSIGDGGMIDIEAGTLILNGDVESDINAYVTAGKIAAYSTRGGGTVNVDYNITNAGKTTVTATPIGDTSRAYNPSPEDEDTGVATDANLSWSAGDYAVSHNVYFGTSFSDVNDANDPNTAPGKGNQAGTTYDPDLTEGTTYYWRIDEVNNSEPNSPWKGDTWSFTTCQGTAASNYYVSANDGNDNNPGTLALPFKTISKANETIKQCCLLPNGGVTVWIRNGTYRETVTVEYSGTASKPVVFTAYSNESPLVSGADVFNGTWSVHSGNIYKATTTEQFIQFFVDGQMMNEARWPNAAVNNLVNMPRGSCDSGTSTTTLVDDDLPTGSWNGAYVHITPGDEWVSYTKGIKNYQAGTSLEFTNTTWPVTELQPEAGDPYWLFGSLDGLDIATEWFLDDTNDTVYLWCPDDQAPGNVTVEIKKRDHAFDLSGKSYIQVKGLQIFAADISLDGSSHCTVDDCHLKYADHLRFVNGYSTGMSGCLMGGSDNEWKNSSMAFSTGTGIRDTGLDNKVTNCVIHDVASIAGRMAAIDTTGYQGGEYTWNTMYNSGRHILNHTSVRDFRIEHNRMYNAGLLTKDVGVTYAWGTDANNGVIAYNHVHDNSALYGCGIYLDHSNSGYTVHHNYIWSISHAGVQTNTPSHDNYIYNNTILESCDYAFNYYTRSGETDSQEGFEFINNLAKSTMNFVTGPKAPTAHHNGDYEVDANGWPTDSNAIDAGYDIPGITDGNVGPPDIGCYEVGTSGWTAGAVLKKATAPVPADGATYVDRNIDLSWTAGKDANAHDVYFGTDFDAVADANHSSSEFKGNQASTSYDPNTLSYNTTYYWAIDEVNGANVWWGDVWSFTTTPQIAQFTPPTDDSFVRMGGASTNYGDLTYLRVRDETIYSYIKFTVSDVSGAVFSAKLKLHCDTGMPDCSVYGVTGDWNEATITWNNDDLVWGDLLDSKSGISAGEWYEFDVSQHITGNGTYTFGLKTSLDETGPDWNSKESDYAPVLTVEFTDSLPGKASSPSPADDANQISTNAALSWTAGQYATSHDVYLGTNQTDVNDANTSSPLFEGNQSGTTYEPNTMDINTTYYWRIDEKNASGTTKGDLWNFTTNPYTDDVVNWETTVDGTITSGDGNDTHDSDNTYEAIQEDADSSGPPSNRKSYLEHKWTINVTGSNNVTFYVEAYHTENTEGDDFTFSYATVDADPNYSPMVTVTKTSDNNQCQNFELPSDTSGTVYIRVKDDDRTGGNKSKDTIYIDHMYIRSEL